MSFSFSSCRLVINLGASTFHPSFQVQEAEETASMVAQTNTREVVSKDPSIITVNAEHLTTFFR